MKLSSQDKKVLLSAVKTEVARLERAVRATDNQSIKEIYQADIVALNDVGGRVFNEPEAK